MDRRTFLKLSGGSAITLTLPAIFPSAANAEKINTIRELPTSDIKRVAWTVDDGTSPEAVKRYIRLVSDNDLRLTFFMYTAMGSWMVNRKELQPLVDSGQIQLANHTMHHPALATLNTKAIQRELMGAHNYIEKHFGVDVRPYYRPPYGSINQKVINAAAEIGYTKPMLWSGSLGDASNIRAPRILQLARSSFYDGSIVLAHANNLTSSKVFPEIMKVINRKELTLVTLADAFDEV
jgi:peptidoglycan/xylan/chitin deacetylase (PgdA/CDA1 family)